jgi:NADH-quinone oxidoreductase subunit E
MKKRLKLPDLQNTTSDGLFTLELVSCLGACGLAPAVVLNDKMYGPMTAESTVELIDEVIAREEGDANE